MNDPKTLPSSTASLTYNYHMINGVRIFYREAGPKDAPVIILLHGYPSSSRMYDPLIPLLAPYYHVIAPDYPGFGLSDAPSPETYTYSFDNIAHTVLKFLDELKIEHYTLFMQDYGGPVGFRMAMVAPNKLEGIIVQNANAYEEGLGKKWAKLALYWQDPDAHQEQLDGFISHEGAKQRHLGNTPNPERYNPDCWEEEYSMLSRPGAREIQGALFYDYQNNVASYPVWQKWMREHQPKALILWGKYDPSFIVPGAQAYLRDLPEANLHILDAGHFALDEATEQVAELTMKFIRSL
ncbi:alpha/beta fold hydrolase [Klebsiella aerogenes]